MAENEITPYLKPNMLAIIIMRNIKKKTLKCRKRSYKIKYKSNYTNLQPKLKYG